MSFKGKRQVSLSPSQREIIILCLNPKCPTPDERCLDSRSIRTHPSDCTPHYFSVDTILETKWNEITDYPSDPLGVSVSRKINAVQKENRKGNNSVLRKFIENFKEKIAKSLEIFEKTMEEQIPFLRLEELYNETYSLEEVSKYLKEKSDTKFISKLISSNFSKRRYGELDLINKKMEEIYDSFNNILSGFKTQLKSLLDNAVSFNKSGRELEMDVFKTEEKTRIEFGLKKSNYITSSKITCKNGTLLFPKIENVVSFLPWVYTERSFNSGVHEIKFTSLKYPSVLNSGVCILEEQDIDTYPYTYFKSLFSAEGKGFQLSNSSQLDELSPYSETAPETDPIETVIGSAEEIVLKLELGGHSRAILSFPNHPTTMYTCPLPQGHRFRMGLYGGGWAIEVRTLF